MVVTLVWADTVAYNPPAITKTRARALRRKGPLLRNLFHQPEMFVFIKTKFEIVYCLSGAAWLKGLLQSRVLVVSQAEFASNFTGDLKPDELGVA